MLPMAASGSAWSQLHVKLIILAVLMNHILGCLWWGVGQTQEGEKIGWGFGPLVSGRTVLYQYLTAYHWSLAQFQGSIDVMPGNTILERAYSVATVLFALLAFAWFVSTLTNMLMQLEACRSERTRMNRVIQSFLGRHGISSHLSMKVKGYVKWKMEQMSCYEYDDEVLNMLPQQLVMDLMEEMMVPKINMHRCFFHMHRSYPKVVRRLCKDGLQNILPGPNQRIFGPYDECHRMYFVVSGQLTYFVKALTKRMRESTKTTKTNSRRIGWGAKQAELDNRPRFQVTAGQHLGEAVLWVNWEYCGDLVSDSSTVCLLALESDRFAEIIKSQPAPYASPVIYARRFAAGLNRFGKVYTDLIDLTELLVE